VKKGKIREQTRKNESTMGEKVKEEIQLRIPNIIKNIK
jgi:hypothetical protein